MIEYIKIHSCEKIKEILLAFHDCFPKVLDRVPSFDEYAQKLSQNAEVISMINDGNVIGYLAYYANDQVDYIGYITLIGILPGFQKLGYGQTLIKYCFELMKKSGMKTAKLEVSIDNISAMSFYKKIGFVDTGYASNESKFMIINI